MAGSRTGTIPSHSTDWAPASPHGLDGRARPARHAATAWLVREGVAPEGLMTVSIVIYIDYHYF